MLVGEREVVLEFIFKERSALILVGIFFLIIAFKSDLEIRIFLYLGEYVLFEFFL